MQLNDTIVALATAPGPGARAIVRLSGPQSVALVEGMGSCPASLRPVRRLLTTAGLHLPGCSSLFPADLYVWPAPATYTGQELVEIHTLSSPPLVDLLITTLLKAGARAAGPGEFTLRGFLAGKLDLTRAEAVLGVIEAADRDELKQALGQLAGGIGRPMQELRDDLLNLLADVEAGLDFTDEDIQFVKTDELLGRISKGLAQLLRVQRQLEQRGTSERILRVVLAGRPNVGKSTLFNALTGATALVSPTPGTTRDYLQHRLDLGDCSVYLIDTAGLRSSDDNIESAAQALGRGQVTAADLVLLCLESGQVVTVEERDLLRQETTLPIGTKADLGSVPTDILATSAATGQGLTELLEVVRQWSAMRKLPPLAPSLSRCQGHVQACLDHLRRAHGLVLFEDPPELLALELREALERLGEMVGAVYTDDLLDRIFSRFCIGK
jgi:tRNA modification GTPase